MTRYAHVVSTTPPRIHDTRWDRIADIVLGLLFELTQQAARFGAAANPWSQLAVYDVDDFAPFTTDAVA
ncbi:hypothetical protein [Streptomyces sp. NPDC008092]|uniref:hypothetical protein n=1 Tax=Streptomyces sp. NPDC008092 TaxID=3364808 RepID=UPI0036EE5FC4